MTARAATTTKRTGPRATDIGYADYPRLAGGPTGLFLLAGTPSGGLEVRRYNGVTFGPGVALAAAGDDAQDHITQDAAGRLHAVFPQGRPTACTSSMRPPMTARHGARAPC